jgi:hypothetical protein
VIVVINMPATVIEVDKPGPKSSPSLAHKALDWSDKDLGAFSTTTESASNHSGLAKATAHEKHIISGIGALAIELHRKQAVDNIDGLIVGLAAELLAPMQNS